MLFSNAITHTKIPPPTLGCPGGVYSWLFFPFLFPQISIPATDNPTCRSQLSSTVFNTFGILLWVNFFSETVEKLNNICFCATF